MAGMFVLMECLLIENRGVEDVIDLMMSKRQTSGHEGGIYTQIHSHQIQGTHRMRSDSRHTPMPRLSECADRHANVSMPLAR